MIRSVAEPAQQVERSSTIRTVMPPPAERRECGHSDRGRAGAHARTIAASATNSSGGENAALRNLAAWQFRPAGVASATEPAVRIRPRIVLYAGGGERPVVVGTGSAAAILCPRSCPRSVLSAGGARPLGS